MPVMESCCFFFFFLVGVAVILSLLFFPESCSVHGQTHKFCPIG